MSEPETSTGTLSGVVRDPLHALCLGDAVWAERYEGWTELGHGGSATVVRTRSRATDEELALKIFTRLDDDGRRRFQQEARHNQLLASPYVVRTHSPFLRAGLAWIEMEWVDGPDLRHELRRRERTPFSSGEALRLGAAVARALVAAHEAGVIHRDVKPANVLLPRSGRPVAKLGDFGISRVAGAARVTATGFIAGTPQFVAPEVIAGQPADARSDVYSLGLTLYLLFSGNRFPFDVATDDVPARWLEAHARLPPRPLRALVPEADPVLEALLERALRKDPAERPSAAELVATLDALAPGGASPDAPTPPAGARTERLEPAVEPQPTVVTRERRARRRGWALGLLALLALTAGWALWRARPQSPASVSAPSPAPTAARVTPLPATPASAAPVAVPSPTPTPAEVALGLTAALAGRPDAPLLVLTNAGRKPLPPLALTLVAADGATCRGRVAEPLAPGAELWIALDSLTPAPPPHLRALRVELALDDGRRATLPLAPR